ncbi:hypothetical protein I4U23_010729 [Adineta vaga]|nr:hypothetical protein I4U23_010729 [Adineta vaga]
MIKFVAAPNLNIATLFGLCLLNNYCNDWTEIFIGSCDCIVISSVLFDSLNDISDADLASNDDDYKFLHDYLPDTEVDANVDVPGGDDGAAPKDSSNDYKGSNADLTSE